jgi:hypothetical protein
VIVLLSLRNTLATTEKVTHSVTFLGLKEDCLLKTEEVMEAKTKITAAVYLG